MQQQKNLQSYFSPFTSSSSNNLFFLGCCFLLSSSYSSSSSFASSLRFLFSPPPPLPAPLTKAAASVFCPGSILFWQSRGNFDFSSLLCEEKNKEVEEHERATAAKREVEEKKNKKNKKAKEEDIWRKTAIWRKKKEKRESANAAGPKYRDQSIRGKGRIFFFICAAYLRAGLGDGWRTFVPSLSNRFCSRCVRMRLTWEDSGIRTSSSISWRMGNDYSVAGQFEFLAQNFEVRKNWLGPENLCIYHPSTKTRAKSIITASYSTWPGAANKIAYPLRGIMPA